MSYFTESIVEEATLEWIEGLGYTPIHASEIAPKFPNPERQSYANIFFVKQAKKCVEALA